MDQQMHARSISKMKSRSCYECSLKNGALMAQERIVCSVIEMQRQLLFYSVRYCNGLNSGSLLGDQMLTLCDHHRTQAS